VGIFLQTISIWEAWQQASLRHLQVVVFGKVHEEVPSHRLVATQIRMNHHTLDVAYRLGNAPG